MNQQLDLTVTVNQRYDRLSPKQQAVAQVLAADPAALAFASAADVAERAGVDTATVVRTCQSLGFSGWRQLNQQIRRSVAERRTFAERVEALTQPGDDIIERIFNVARDNVAETERALSREALSSAAAAIAGADLVVVAAGGVSTGLGQFLSSSLQIIGHRAVETADVGDAGAAIAPLHEGDVVVGISMWRYLRTTVQALEHAAKVTGATTVAITDSPLSPAALLADHVLVAQTETVGPRLGLAGVVALIEALVASVALLDPARSRRASRIASELYFDRNVLSTPDIDPLRTDSWQQRLDQEAGGD
jgi:DNA-binding MurR/RpiR family transcriptional regulator